MTFVIVNATFGDPVEGSFLAGFDPDWRPDDRPVYPCGRVDWTPKLADALRFDTAVDAWSLWTSTSSRIPVRPDGRPNRPLTAYTIEVRNADE